MQIEKRNARHFSEEIHECPQNAGLFPDCELYNVLQGGSATSADKRAAKAELAVRMFLSKQRYSANRDKGLLDVEALLNDWIGPDVLCSFFKKAETCGLCTDYRQRINSIFKLLESEDRKFDDVDAEAIRRAFRPWFEAEGVIPVFNESGAYLLPFWFLGERAEPEVIDANGNFIEEWTLHLRTLQRDFGINRSVQVAFHQNEFVKANGNSLMLPLVMAWNRKYVEAPRRLPCYNPIRFISTGAIKGGRLDLVSTEEKLQKISDDVDQGVLVRPGNGKDSGTILAGERIEDVLQMIREMAELDYDTAPSNAYARLHSLDRIVRQRCHENWERMNARIDRLMQAVDEDAPAEERLNAVMLRSVARCHAGRTEEAKKFNEEAQELARDLLEFDESRLLRLQVEELVILQDEEDFDRVYSLACSLGDRIKSYCDAHNSSEDYRHCLDLQMRYNGTIGQFEAYAALSGDSNHSASAAKRYFEKAFDCAQKLARKNNATDLEEEYSISLADCAQDANYLLLWHALFDEQKMSDSFALAKKYADKLRNSGQDRDADKNDSFRRRFAALGMYMAVLKDEKIPKVDDDIECAVREGNDWVKATVGKYLGAVAAKKGRQDEAKKFFELACAQLEGKKGVLGEIHMTVLAESYRSMRRVDEEYAEQKRQAAISTLDDADVTCSKRHEWKCWLQSEGEDGDFPGLKFWY